MANEGLVALAVLGAVAVAAVAADRRRRRPGAAGTPQEHQPTADEVDAADEDTIGQIDYESPIEDEPLSQGVDPLD